MITKAWSKEELEAIVELYAELLHNESGQQADIALMLSQGISRIATRLGRDSFDYRLRMSAVSGVLKEMGLTWLAHVQPVHIQHTSDILYIKELVAKLIDINQDILQVTADPLQLALRSAEIVRRGLLTSPPAGSISPHRISATSELFLRDPRVRAWVLSIAKGICECCCRPAPFCKQDGQPYLEVHHFIRLADGGSDTIDNTVAVCPNCHRQLHYGIDSEELRDNMWVRVVLQRTEQAGAPRVPTPNGGHGIAYNVD